MTRTAPQEDSQELAAMRTQCQAATSGAGDELAAWPSWPPQPPCRGEAYHVDPWGHVVVSIEADETDILIEFDTSSLEAQHAALAFAEALTARVQELQPAVRVEFIAAGDHYHVRCRDFGSREFRAAHALYATITRRAGKIPRP